MPVGSTRTTGGRGAAARAAVGGSKNLKADHHQGDKKNRCPKPANKEADKKHARRRWPSIMAEANITSPRKGGLSALRHQRADEHHRTAWAGCRRGTAS
jgi:hypothetical protein